MNTIPSLSLLATLLLPAAALAQGRVGSLAQAQETFSDIDISQDGKLSPEEVSRKLQLGGSDVRGFDADHDGFWSRDEFLVFYRQRLTAANVKPAADLEAEATRILAARKAKAAEKGSPRGLSDVRRPAATSAAAGALSDAFDDLEVKASAGKARQADFDHVRELLVAEAQAADQAAQGEDPVAGEKSELQAKLLQSIERLRTSAASGNYSREEYQALRASFVRRARNAGTVGADSNAIQKGLLDSLDQLEQRAAAGNATREDFQHVRDQLIARARAASNGPNGAAALEAELQGPVHRKLMQSLERLENAAQEGNFSREEYKQLRESMVQRARDIENPAQPRAGSAAARTEEAGMNQAVDELEKRVDGGQVAPADFKQLHGLIAGKAEAAAAKTDPQSASEAQAYKKLMQSLERLEKAAQNGSVDRQEFQAFKDSFVHRARQIANDSQQTSSAAGERSKSSGEPNAGGGKRAGAPVVTPAGAQPLPGEKGAAKGAEPARDGGGKGETKPAPKPAPQPAPQSRPKPDGQEPEKPARPSGGG